MAELDGLLFQLVSHYKANFSKTVSFRFPKSDVFHCFSIFKHTQSMYMCIIYIYNSLQQRASVFDGTVGDFASHTVKDPAGAGAHRGPGIRIARAAKGET